MEKIVLAASKIAAPVMLFYFLLLVRLLICLKIIKTEETSLKNK